GRMTATALARELEVSTRTVLRDLEALSAAGVPVYAERGRNGGFALLPGFRTELTGLNHDEALALLAAGSARGEQVFGLGSALASALRKLVDALPETHQATASGAAQRFLVDPETDLLSRRQLNEEIPDDVMAGIRRAVLNGHRLRIHYAAADQSPQWRTVDPTGLGTVRGRGHPLATRAGAARTYPPSPVPAVASARRRRAPRAGRAPGPCRSRPALAGAQQTVPGRRRPDHRGDPGAPGSPAGACGDGADRPRGAGRCGRLAAPRGDLPGRTTRRVGAVAARPGRRGAEPTDIAHGAARPRRHDRRPLRSHALRGGRSPRAHP